jgi:ArsR family transcriptional regulator
MVLSYRCLSVLPADAQYYRCVTIDSAGSGSGLDAAVALFRGLADGTRLTIVGRLARRETRVADLVTELGLAQSTVSAHVGCLRECGLVAGRPQGRQVFYSLTRPELLDLLAAAETLLAATGNTVALCPSYGTAGASGSAGE